MDVQRDGRIGDMANVRIGTAAAGIQSTVYGAYVPAGSLFALLQGVGALIGV